MANSIALWINKSIRRKLIFYFLILSLLPNIIIGIISYSRASLIITEQNQQYLVDQLENFGKRFEILVSQYNEVAKDINLLEVFDEDDYFLLPNSERNYRVKSIESYLRSAVNEIDYIEGIVLDMDDYTVEYGDTELIQKKESTKYLPVWYTDDESQRIYISQAIYEKESFDIIGQLYILVEYQLFSELYLKYFEHLNVDLVIDLDGFSMVMSRGMNTDDHSIPIPNFMENRLQKTLTGDEYGFTFHASVEEGYLYQDVIILMIQVAILVLIVAVFTIVLAVDIANQFVKPFSGMIEVMKINRQGDLQKKIEISSHNEIGEVASNYNQMIDQLAITLREIEHQYTAKRKSELKALQAQISPHFLYNTLNSIRCMARVNKEHEIFQAISSTIELLQMTVSHHSDLIRVEDELSIVRNYVQLYVFRMNCQINVNYHIDASLKDNVILKFTVQPFVENAIKHGLDLSSKEATLDISTVKVDDVVEIVVSDNGKGMTERQIEQLYDEQRADSGHKFNGIGVRNVQERLQLYFGETYGVSYKSKIGQGTEVKITLPLRGIGDSNEKSITG